MDSAERTDGNWKITQVIEKDNNQDSNSVEEYYTNVLLKNVDSNERF